MTASHFTEGGGLPRLVVDFHPPREKVVLNKAGKPKATGEWVPWTARVTMAPLPTPLATGEPSRLRAMAKVLHRAADELEALQRAHTTPQLDFDAAPRVETVHVTNQAV